MSSTVTSDISAVVEVRLRKYDSLRLAYGSLKAINPNHRLLSYVRLDEFPSEDLPTPRLSTTYPVSVSVQFYPGFDENYNPSNTSDSEGLPTGLEKFVEDLELAAKAKTSTILTTSLGHGPDNMVPSSCC
ncbi:hypothetical protein J4218_02530 [Candidatus Pacearchaeota archaeon]|nr:hypothetical protein [Candidatus Pacearchaeota archaeon]